MKHILIFASMVLLTITASAQNKKYLGVAVFNTQTDLPFGKLTGLFTKAFHPGIEATWGKSFSIRQKHDWFWDARFAYFFHRFVQHGIPFYVNIGYRYRAGAHFSADAAVGAGAMLSVPATSKLKLNNGEYQNNKGIGRLQAIATFSLGAGYTFRSTGRSPKVFIVYQQRLQAPFVRSYVPILPYNNFMIGISKPIGKK
jgi:hypothetical protein